MTRSHTYPTCDQAHEAIAPDFFDELRYPTLLRVVHGDRYGRMELLSVAETSDGFLIGHALVGEGEGAHHKSIFLGRTEDYKGSASRG